MQWYRIETALPDDNKDVLCVVEKKGNKEMHVGRWNGKFWIVGNFFEWDIGKVIFWGDLPRIPD
jgi:hypothetical protein